jgi:hypothetical protein
MSCSEWSAAGVPRSAAAAVILFPSSIGLRVLLEFYSRRFTLAGPFTARMQYLKCRAERSPENSSKKRKGMAVFQTYIFFCFLFSSEEDRESAL